ncbi:MAG: MATE family efflux transporter [Clostridia bacterium]|nr:MATE family efflux transporter [Clostridia bacterium]
MSQIMRDRSFYKQLAILSIPIALQNLIGFGVNMMDTVMLGSLGQDQISASSLANQPFFILTLFFFGLSSGASVLTSQYWGKRDTRTISRVIGLAVRASLLFSAVFAFVVLVFPEAVMSIYTTDPHVILLGTQFLRIIGFSYILSAFSTTFLNVIRSVESVRIPLLINFITFAVNTVLNWILIYGKFGMPALGIRGSATATLIARVIELTLSCLFAFRFDQKIRLRLRDVMRFDNALFHDFLHYSLPVVVNETMWGVGMTLQSVVVGHMGSEAVAANSIASVVQRLAMVYTFGLASSAAVLVGKEIGSGNEKRARSVASTLLLISIAAGLVSSAVIILLRAPFAMIYNVPASTKELSMQIMLVFSVIVFFSAFNCSNIVGVLRGGGDTRFALALDITLMYVVALPLGALAGLYWHLPVPIVFFLLLCDEPMKCIIGIFRFRSGRWLRNVTRETVPDGENN